jgi:protein TonB
MTDPLPERRPFPILWIAALALMVAACAVGLVLQLGSYRSELVDRARTPGVRIPKPDEPAPRTTRSKPREPGLPAYGEFVYVEELPEAIERVPPEYPEAARQANVAGTVIVQALIGRDGLVKETKVVQSIEGLDEAAESAVAQWTFKPAKTKGEPVAVWVAVPVKFTLN